MSELRQRTFGLFDLTNDLYGKGEGELIKEFPTHEEATAHQKEYESNNPHTYTEIKLEAKQESK